MRHPPHGSARPKDKPSRCRPVPCRFQKWRCNAMGTSVFLLLWQYSFRVPSQSIGGCCGRLVRGSWDSLHGKHAAFWRATSCEDTSQDNLPSRPRWWRLSCHPWARWVKVGRPIGHIPSCPMAWRYRCFQKNCKTAVRWSCHRLCGRWHKAPMPCNPHQI